MFAANSKVASMNISSSKSGTMVLSLKAPRYFTQSLEIESLSLQGAADWAVFTDVIRSGQDALQRMQMLSRNKWNDGTQTLDALSASLRAVSCLERNDVGLERLAQTHCVFSSGSRWEHHYSSVSSKPK